MEQVRLLKGDNRELLKTLETNSVDSVVTDPPYALTSIKNRFGKPGSAEAQYGTDGVFQRASKGFMGKEWDSEVPSVEVWKEVLRVLKPGGHVLAFGGTRTYHHLVMNMELAGFEIRDSISYMYGSGFPKSHNIGKAVDKLNGNEREVVGENPYNKLRGKGGVIENYSSIQNKTNITKGNSEWEGWGTALKPSMELICLARKPLTEKSIAENVLKHGTGGINIDDCRVETTDTYNYKNGPQDNSFSVGKEPDGKRTEPVEMHSEGRFPANTILECICDEVIPGEKGEIIESSYKTDGYDNTHEWGYDVSKAVRKTRTDTGDIHTNPECPCYILDKQSGVSITGASKPKQKYSGGNLGGGNAIKDYPSSKGGASRFFYTAKVSKKERNMGLDGFEEKLQAGAEFRPNHMVKALNGEDGNPYGRYTPTKNNHPTVKPINLMTYLCRLITPPNGVVLDMYMGSGSTGISALLEGFNFIGMEMDEDYFNIAEGRINNYEQYRQFKK